jgi:CHAT domain-containing protein
LHPGATKAKVFHFSGHAIVKPEVALAMNDENEMGQQLTDQEIGLMSNPMDMVVLSACSGIGQMGIWRG